MNKQKILEFFCLLIDFLSKNGFGVFPLIENNRNNQSLFRRN